MYGKSACRISQDTELIFHEMPFIKLSQCLTSINTERVAPFQNVLNCNTCLDSTFLHSFFTISESLLRWNCFVFDRNTFIMEWSDASCYKIACVYVYVCVCVHVPGWVVGWVGGWMDGCEKEREFIFVVMLKRIVHALRSYIPINVKVFRKYWLSPYIIFMSTRLHMLFLDMHILWQHCKCACFSLLLVSQSTQKI